MNGLRFKSMALAGVIACLSSLVFTLEAPAQSLPVVDEGCEVEVYVSSIDRPQALAVASSGILYVAHDEVTGQIYSVPPGGGVANPCTYGGPYADLSARGFTHSRT